MNVSCVCLEPRAYRLGVQVPSPASPPSNNALVPTRKSEALLLAAQRGVRAFKMIEIHGPSNPAKPPRPGSFEITFPKPLLAEAETLGKALSAYSQRYGVRFVPYDGSDPHVPFDPGEAPKYFFYKKPNGSSQLVDIHIERRGEIICAKQDLSFRLQDGDAVRIGPLAC